VSVSEQWQPERPCPIPGHPADDGTGTAERLAVPDSAWARIRRWHLHAPAERLPLPAIPAVWTAAEILHLAAVPGLYPGVATVAAAGVAFGVGERHARDPERKRLRGAEVAAVTAITGAWLTAGTIAGPLAGPDHALSIAYGLGAAGGYWWLRRHEAVRAARQRREDLAAAIADKALWHQILHRIGLDGWHVQERRDTLIGEERLITTSPENALASRIAGASSGIAEKLAHILGLPYGRIDITTTDFPGQLVIGIRTVDLAVRAAAFHPFTTPWPDSKPSPFTPLFPETDTIRNPVIWGFSPEDGSPLALSLFSDIGGRAVGVIGMTGSGKSNVLNDVREHVTRCPDARLVQINGAHMGDELTWEPLSAITVCGPAASDEKVRNDIAAVLEWACLEVTRRSATLAETGHSTFQPTPQDPAIGIIIDEVDEVTKELPGAAAAIEFLAGKQRKSAVFLVLATQRAIVKALGGGGVRANMSQVLVGKVARATESRHATGAESEIPDIREYAHGEPGYFQSWNPHSGTVDGRGRAFLLGKPPEELAYIKRLVAARRGWRDWSIPNAAPLVLDGGESAAEAPASTQAQEIGGMRARLASILGRAHADGQDEDQAPEPVTPVPAVRLPLTIPRAIGDTLLALLAAGGASSSQAAAAAGISKSTAHEYLSALRDAGVAELTAPRGRSSRFILARTREPEPPPAGRPDGYVTLHDLAEAVRDGRAGDVDDDARAVLAKVLQAGPRPRLTVVPEPESDAS